MAGRGVTARKQQRYREWRVKSTKLKTLRKQTKDKIGNFVPSHHGFNFDPYAKMEVDNDMKDEDSCDEISRKRRLVDVKPKHDNEPWLRFQLPEAERQRKFER